MTSDNAANILATYTRGKHKIELLSYDFNNVIEMEKHDNKSHEFTSALSNELVKNLNLVMILDMVNRSDTSVKKLQALLKKCKHIKKHLVST